MNELGLKSRETFRKNYMNPAIELGLVHMTIPKAKSEICQEVTIPTYKHYL
ncbi:MAG: hypothetical protein NC393_04935 [Clostridium sp.]|nr:hypothetical protein [Clostridium sp.]MCM1209645.1 hypothetical protein [Ruminococcus sp.]